MTEASEQYRLLSRLSDDELFEDLGKLVVGEREHLVDVLARLGILQDRNAQLPRGYSSLFVYCLRELRYCERTAYKRLSAAKLCRRFPRLLDRLRAGRVHLTAVELIGGHLTPENFDSLLARAEGASIEELKRLAASLTPVDAPPPERTRILAVVRPIPAAEDRPDGGGSGDKSHVEESGLSEPERIAFRTEHTFTLNEGAEAKLKRVRELMAHRFPMGDIESIFEAALDSLLDASDPARRSPRPPSKPRAAGEETRRIPEWVRRAVRARDEERCAFVSASGARCGERRFLQFDHIVPWSLGGRSDDPKNVRQLCGAHNRWAWRHAFVTRR